VGSKPLALLASVSDRRFSRLLRFETLNLRRVSLLSFSPQFFYAFFLLLTDPPSPLDFQLRHFFRPPFQPSEEPVQVVIFFFNASFFLFRFQGAFRCCFLPEINSNSPDRTSFLLLRSNSFSPGLRILTHNLFLQEADSPHLRTLSSALAEAYSELAFCLYGAGKFRSWFPFSDKSLFFSSSPELDR